DVNLDGPWPSTVLRCLHGESRTVRADPGSSEGRAEIPAVESVRQGGAGQVRLRLQGGQPRSREVLGEAGEAAPVDEAVEEGARLEAAVREMVHRRQAQHLRQLPRPPR